MTLNKEPLLEVNTIQAAKDYISQDGFYTTDYMLYTVAVARKCKSFGRIIGLSEEEIDLLLMAAYLHNAGRFIEEKKSRIHQHNAYITLKNLGWNEDVCLLILHHLDGYGLRKLIAPTSSTHVFKEPLPARLETLNQILTLSSLITGPKGESVTLEERIELGVKRYNENHIRVKHLRNLANNAQSWVNKLFFGNI